MNTAVMAGESSADGCLRLSGTCYAKSWEDGLATAEAMAFSPEEPPGPARQALAVGMTIARYPLAELVRQRVADRRSIGWLMLGVVAADWADGEVLRRVGASAAHPEGLDVPARRVADGMVDYAQIGRVGYQLDRSYPETRAINVGLLMTQLTMAGLNAYHWAMTGEVTKGGRYKRAASLAIAGYAVAAARGREQHTRLAGAFAVAVGAAASVAHMKRLGLPHDGTYRRLDA